MGKFREVTFQQSLRGFVSSKEEHQRTIKMLMDVAEDKIHPKDLPPADIELLERAASALIRCCRVAGPPAKKFQLRQLHLSEDRRIDAAKERLQLKCRWRDHMKAIDAQTGRPILIAEPYGLGEDDFEDFRKMREDGWTVEICQGLASHYPSCVAAVKLIPPFPVGKRIQKLLDKQKAFKAAAKAAGK